VGEEIIRHGCFYFSSA